jgi:hypothetical protein
MFVITISVNEDSMDISQMARENDILKEYIHINEVLIDLMLERQRVLSVIDQYNLPDFTQEWYNKHKDILEPLLEKRKHLQTLLATFH